MESIFFMDIDTQRDFMLPGGALYVPGAEKIIPRLRQLFDFARTHRIFLLSSADAHSSNDLEFQQFPPHCVKGTEGQRKIDETLMPRPLILENRPIDRNIRDAVQKYRQIIYEKQSLDVFSNPVAEKIVRTLPPHALVFGVTTEYCVRMACLALRRMGIKTAVISDAVRALDARSGKKAVEEMRRAGVEFTTSDALMTSASIG